MTQGFRYVVTDTSVFAAVLCICNLYYIVICYFDSHLELFDTFKCQLLLQIPQHMRNV